jgi:predicted PurR-regulated permease PerM
MIPATANSVTERPQQECDGLEWLRPLAVVAFAACVAYLCWRILSPFLPSLCWALAVAIIAEPVKAWLIRHSVPRAAMALIIILVVILAIFGPGFLLMRAVSTEASEILNRTTIDAGAQWFRGALQNTTWAAPLLRWLDSHINFPADAVQIARSLAGWVSVTISALFAGSVWLLSQLVVTFFVLFYFLRDGEVILSRARLLLPLPDSFVNTVFTRVAQVIRVSLAGKVVVATIQGALGGLMFFWLGLPAPVFWGTVMAALSIFPVIGAFAVWLPAALILMAQGDWKHALALACWGVVVIHPVDNLLGPMLVGGTLRLHTLFVFFPVIGGIAAFGASGVVLGPVTAAVAVAFADWRNSLKLPIV